MRRTWKKLTAVCTAAMMLTGAAPNLPGGVKLLHTNLTASAEDAPTSGTCGDNLTWRFHAETGTLTIEGSGAMHDYEDASGVPWWAYRSKIKAVSLPDGMTSISQWAFPDCTGLTSIIIPDGVTSIGSYAFVDCTGLTGIIIPNSVTSIGSFTFSGCTGLPGITIPDSVTSIGGAAFCDCTGLTSITIPDGVTCIDWRVFSDCTSLKSIAIPESVTSIGIEAFRGCTGLTSITIPVNVADVGYGAFQTCNNLSAVTVMNCKSTCFDSDVFSGCSQDLTFTGYDGSEIVDGYKPYRRKTGTCGDNLTWRFDAETGTLTIEGSGDMRDYYSITYDIEPPKLPWNGYDSQIKTVSLPDGITSIGDNAFAYCTGLTGITISNGVTRIGRGAFSRLTGLTDITIPDSVTSFGWGAFTGTGWLKAKQEESPFVVVNGILIDGTTCSGDIVIPDSVTSIGELAFYDCTGLKSVMIPDSVTSIERDAFCYCSGLTSIIIPGSVTSIGEGVLSLTPWLETKQKENTLVVLNGILIDGTACSGDIAVPDGVTSISDNAFYGCTGLKSVTIPGSVKSIGEHAFMECTGLTSVIISDGVTTIGDDAFSYCNVLRSVTVPDSVTSIGINAFYSCPILIIKGHTGSYAEEFAKLNRHEFEALFAGPFWGDANCDNAVDIADAVLICRFAVADAEAGITDQGRKMADVTHDGKVDAKDSEKIVRYIARFLTADDLNA